MNKLTLMYPVLKADYENVRAQYPEANLKPYDELTEDEKSKHAAIHANTTQFFGQLALDIHNGKTSVLSIENLKPYEVKQ